MSIQLSVPLYGQLLLVRVPTLVLSNTLLKLLNVNLTEPAFLATTVHSTQSTSLNIFGMLLLRYYSERLDEIV